MPVSPASSRQRFEDYKSQRNAAWRERRPLGTPANRQRSAWQLVVEFFRLLRGHYRSIAFALVTLACATVLGLIPPAATKFLVDYVLPRQPLPASVPAWVPRDSYELLLLVTVGVLALTFLKIAIHVSGRWSATRTTKRIQMSVRKKVFEHAVRLPLPRVYDLKSGGVASLLREDAGSVGELVFGMLYNPFRAAIQLSGSLIILAWIDWRLLLGALILLPMVYVTHRTWINRIRPQYRDIRARRQSIDAYATEAFGGMRVVRAFSRQRREAAKFMNENHLMGRHELYLWWWSRTVEIIWSTLIPLASAALLVYGGWQVLDGNLTIGDLMMFLVYLLMLLEPLGVLAQSAAQFQNSLSGLDRILDLLAEPLEMSAVQPTRNLERTQVTGRVTFENVGFRYEGNDHFALSGVSLDVQPGQCLALVGPSGAGKTTLCNLVARFFDPSEGRILLDGVDVRAYHVEQYRNLLGVVEQDVFLFDGTVAENIGYARRDASPPQLRRAAQIANAHEFIEQLQDGYETVIGERGVKLSGGQRQRIAIARAVLADPKILILDEATSNLDTHSERLIQESLKRLMAGRTTFVIAHRLSTIRDADRILVLENGRPRESGTHEELSLRGGRYHEMLKVQLHREADHLESTSVEQTPAG